MQESVASTLLPFLLWSSNSIEDLPASLWPQVCSPSIYTVPSVNSADPANLLPWSQHTAHHLLGPRLQIHYLTSMSGHMSYLRKTLLWTLTWVWQSLYHRKGRWTRNLVFSFIPQQASPFLVFPQLCHSWLQCGLTFTLVHDWSDLIHLPGLLSFMFYWRGCIRWPVYYNWCPWSCHSW